MIQSGVQHMQTAVTAYSARKQFLLSDFALKSHTVVTAHVLIEQLLLFDFDFTRVHNLFMAASVN